MSALILAYGGSGGNLDFSGQSCGPVPQTMIYKNKVCELCGKNFTTLAMAPLRDCAACITRTEERTKELNRPLPPDPVEIGRPRKLQIWKHGSKRPLEGERLEHYREYQRTYRAAKRASSAKEAAA